MSQMFHPGELAIQDATGVRDIAGANSKMIRSTIPDHIIPFVTSQSYCVVGGVSAMGDVWAEFVVGAAGFATVGSAGASLSISLGAGGLRERQLDLGIGNHLGLLFIDLSTRKRLRVNGRIAAMSGQNLTLSVDQSFPNCPKYIQARRFRAGGASSDPQCIESGATLPDHVANWITNADTFFVASTATDGAADVSHRGGQPGFVQAQGQTLFIPDYHGNSMFSTLGNFLLNPRAGLLFVDFEANRTLQLTGVVDLQLAAKDAKTASADTGRWWKFRARRYVISSIGSSVSAEFISASPFNPSLAGNPMKSVSATRQDVG
ncbi:flavin-nucleotide-binding protein [Roseobacter denitrificans]|nr:flavin-nucleotide-binding protein [Roseobacter denitrificans]